MGKPRFKVGDIVTVRSDIHHHMWAVTKRMAGLAGQKVIIYATDTEKTSKSNAIYDVIDSVYGWPEECFVIENEEVL